jgi:hypothetical protein
MFLLSDKPQNVVRGKPYTMKTCPFLAVGIELEGLFWGGALPDPVITPFAILVSMSIVTVMHWLRRYQYVLLFLAVLGFCTIKVIGQFSSNEARHAALREDFLLLHDKGYTEQELRFYQKLVGLLQTQPDQTLFQDYQRTSLLVSANQSQPENLVWRYHWQVKKELNQRSPQILAHALRLVEED